MTVTKINQPFKYFQDEKFGHYIYVKVKGTDKIPMSKNWQSYQPVDPQHITAAGCQVGFALGSELFVIDLDLYKKDGQSSARKLLVKYPELKECSRVRTMRGGLHLFLSLKGDNGYLAKTLKDEYPGIDFLRQRMFVMCAGNPGYTWEREVNDWQNLIPVPAGLIAELKAPSNRRVEDSDLDHTVIDSAQLKAILDQLNPNDFNGVEHPKGHGKYEWLKLMMSCAAAVGYGEDQGGGFHVFDTWCRQVEYYADTGCPLPRWNSVKPMPGGVTISSLYSICNKEGVDWREASNLPPKPADVSLFEAFEDVVERQGGKWKGPEVVDVERWSEEIDDPELDPDSFSAFYEDPELESTHTESNVNSAPSEISDLEALANFVDIDSIAKNYSKSTGNTDPSDISDGDLLGILEEVLAKPREEHDEFVVSISDRTGKSITSIQYRLKKLVFIGTETDVNIKLSDRAIANKLIRVLKYVGLDLDPVFTEGAIFYYKSDGCWSLLEGSDLYSFVAEITDNCYGVCKHAQYEHLAKALNHEAKARFKHERFFLDAISGIAFKSQFYTLTSGGQIRFCELLPQHRVRFKFGFDIDIDLAHQYETPLYDQFLDKSVDNLADPTNMQGALIAQFMGAALFDLGPTLGKALMVKGSGANGKSQLLRIFKALSPNPTGGGVLTIEGLRQERSIQAIYDKKVVIMSELPGIHSKVMGKSADFKALITGDEMNTRRLYGEIFDFKFRGILVMSGNNMPNFDDAGKGLERRVLSVSMDRDIDKDDKIANIGERIVREELQGVIVMAMLEVSQMVKSGKEFAKSSEDYNFFEEVDTVQAFVKDKCKVGKHLSTRKSDLYETYLDYCRDELGEEVIGKQAFNKSLKTEYRLTERVSKIDDRKSVRIWIGINLLVENVD